MPSRVQYLEVRKQHSHRDIRQLACKHTITETLHAHHMGLHHHARTFHMRGHTYIWNTLAHTLFWSLRHVITRFSLLCLFSMVIYGPLRRLSMAYGKYARGLDA